MSIAKAFGTSVDADAPADSTSTSGQKIVSDFITVGSFTNFSAMTGAIASAWGGARALSNQFDGRLTPFLLCLLFAVVSVTSSKPGRKVEQWGPVSLIALVNSLTLFSAVIGASAAASVAAG